MEILTGERIEELLTAVGELLQAAGHRCSIVVVGGASLNLLGLLERTTKDIDVAARVEVKEGRRIFVHPDPLPEPLQKAITTVARDFSIPTEWMNTQVATQWTDALPTFLFEEIQWQQYGSLEVGVVGRTTLLVLKLHAAVDRDTDSVHYQDLIELAPTDSELVEARSIVATLDAGTEFPEILDQTISQVKRDVGKN
ncbi:MAG: DUF6036 family nucleotidyltransferase [Acidobacteriota bacterium]